LLEQGRFRKDLYYRLRGVTIHLPPLRERREDIAELAHYFLFRYNRQLGTSVQSISPEALDVLERHDWPGNVRELQSVIREALIVSAGVTILPEFLSAELQRSSVEPEPEVETSAIPHLEWKDLITSVNQWIAEGQTDVYRRAREQFDRLLVIGAMERSGGNQHRAAEILGLSRVTLRARLRQMQLSVQRKVCATGDTARPEET
jgi:two-component system nitrogen regulation response regulator GlnG